MMDYREDGSPMHMSPKYMVETQVKPRGVQDPRVIRAVENVMRDRFVPNDYQRFAYSDCPLPISGGQTISQPYIVAAMTELLCVDKDDRVLEIGTGSGYQTAVLAEIVAEVFTVEIIDSLGLSARKLLEELGYDNIHYHIGDGYYGWPDSHEFDAIIMTAAPVDSPEHLAKQLKVRGRMVAPVGPVHGNQTLYLFEKKADGSLHKESVMDVRFVPLTGKH